MYCFVLPCRVDYFTEDSYPPSKFFSGVNSPAYEKKVEKLTKQFKFGALLPPDSFQAKFEEFSIFRHFFPNNKNRNEGPRLLLIHGIKM
jgi:hypothetical protein